MANRGRSSLARAASPGAAASTRRSRARKKRTAITAIPPVFSKSDSSWATRPSLPDGAKDWPYHQVTDRDAWIDDPKLTDLTYNHLYTLPPGAPLPPWWEKEHMHLGDAAYQWLVLIEHNYDDPVPDAGNEIFFHVRRGEHYRTAGCTTMELDHLERLIKWLQPGSNAMLAELTRADYARLWKDWHLPPPSPSS